VQVEDRMKVAFKPFEQYMDFLADGSLDGYFNSIYPDGKTAVPGIMMSTDINLLLHELGQHVDQKRVETLFEPGTTYVVWNLYCQCTGLSHSQSSIQYLWLRQDSPFSWRSLPQVGFLFLMPPQERQNNWWFP
jgi:hypothetical protein